MTANYIVGDVGDVLATIPDDSIDLVMTSPPFLALRSYLPADHPDKDREIGSEPDPATFLDTLLALTAEWRRVLAPHGSIAVELGDTYSGSGGGGGDYLPGGMREGQQQFAGAASTMRESNAAHWRAKNREGSEWPLPKSLCGIPHLYHLSLAYGRNLLTGEPSPAGQWLVRNVVAWCRPNPPVGALGDKFRPATSYLTIATPNPKRYFDLDAVRTPTNHAGQPWRFVGLASASKGISGGDSGNPGKERVSHNPAGAPPLDYWVIPTAPYSGSHYATFPPALVEKPIQSMVPQRVCRTCGEPSRRIVDATRTIGEARPGAGRPLSQGGPFSDSYEVTTTIGWSDCGHGSYACASCGVLVPSDYALRRPGEGQGSQAPVGDEAVLGEPVEGAGEPTDGAGDLRDVRSGVPGQAGGPVLHEELFGEAGTQGGQAAVDPATDGDAGPEGEPPGLHPGLGAGGHAGTTRERLHDGAPDGDAGAPGSPAGAVGDRPPSQWREGRQPAGEPRGGHEGKARRDGGLPSLPGDVPGQLAEGYVCPCGGREIKYVADHWRTGVVLDPFAGSGTTLMVASGHGRDSIGIDIDERNADLALERVGPLLLTVEHLADRVTP